MILTNALSISLMLYVIAQQQQEKKRNCREEDHVLKRMLEFGVIFPQDFTKDMVVLPDWDRIKKRHHNFEYFEKEHRSKGLGKEYLVLKSYYQESSIPSSIHIPEDDTRLHLKIAELVNSSTRGQRDVLGEILYLAVKSAQRKDDMASIPIPQSGKELRRQFVSNKHSLLNALPHPNVAFLRDYGIAKVTLQGCLADFLAQGTPFQALRGISGSDTLESYLATITSDNLYDR